MVYFIENVETKEIKIGYTGVDPFTRMISLQVSSPQQLVVAAVIPRARKAVEKKLHQRFADESLRGEWFRPSDRLLQFIADVAVEWRDVRRLPKCEAHRAALKSHVQIATLSRAPSPVCLTAAIRWFYLMDMGLSLEEIADREDTEDDVIREAISRYRAEILPPESFEIKRKVVRQKPFRKCVICGKSFDPCEDERECYRCAKPTSDYRPW